MNSPTALSLDARWRVEYFEIDPDLYEFGSTGQPVESLRQWRCEGRYDEGWAAWLRHTFWLEPADACVNYELDIPAAPGRVVLYVNGRRLGEFDGERPFHFDITDYVALEDNWVGLRVACGPCLAGARFGEIRLHTVPCGA